MIEQSRQLTGDATRISRRNLLIGDPVDILWGGDPIGWGAALTLAWGAVDAMGTATAVTALRTVITRSTSIDA